MSLINDALKKANQAQKKRAPQGPLGAPLQPVESLKRPPSHMPKIAAGLLAVILAGASAWYFMGGKTNESPDLALAGTSGLPTVAVASDPGASTPSVESSSSPEVVESPTKTPAEMRSSATPNLPSAVRAQIDTGSAVVATESATQPGVQRTDMASLRMPEPLTTPMTDQSNGGPGAPMVARPAATLEISPPPGVRPSAPPMAPTVSTSRVPAGSAPVVANVPADSAATAAPDATHAEIEFPNLQLQGIFFRMKNPSVMINRRSLFVGDTIAGVRIVDIQRRTVTIEKDGQRKVLSMSGF